jgi:hypothetical protein
MTAGGEDRGTTTFADGVGAAEWPAPPSDIVWVAEPVRAASRTEIVVRLALAAVVAGSLLLTFVAALTRPRPTDYRALLRAANAGRLVRLDLGLSERELALEPTLAGDVVRWRNDDGYYEAPVPGVIDIRAAVRAQPYVAVHPDSVRLGRLESRTHDWGRFAGGLVGFAATVLLIGGPQPRLLTKWAWFFTFGSGFGVLAYLLLGGSWRTSRLGLPARRVNGWHVAAALAAFGALGASLHPDLSRLVTPPHGDGGAYVEPARLPWP